MSEEEKIETTIYLLNQTVDKLNKNYELIFNYNKSICNEKIVITLSMMNYDNDSFNMFLQNKLFDEIKKQINQPFIVDEEIQISINEIISDLKGKNKLEYISNYIDKLFLFQKKEFISTYYYIKKYIRFKKNKFELIPNYKEEISKYYNNKN